VGTNFLRYYGETPTELEHRIFALALPASDCWSLRPDSVFLSAGNPRWVSTVKPPVQVGFERQFEDAILRNKVMKENLIRSILQGVRNDFSNRLCCSLAGPE
jgi:hypothetical protein